MYPHNTTQHSTLFLSILVAWERVTVEETTGGEEKKLILQWRFSLLCPRSELHLLSSSSGLLKQLFSSMAAASSADAQRRRRSASLIRFLTTLKVPYTPHLLPTLLNQGLRNMSVWCGVMVTALREE